jgi:hypothetical protein
MSKIKTIKTIKHNPKTEWELWSAVSLLAHWSDNIKTRLINADEYHFHYITPDDMPTNELKKKLIKTQNKLTKKHALSTTEALRRMKLKTCRSIAESICDLYYGYSHHEWNRNP